MRKARDAGVRVEKGLKVGALLTGPGSGVGRGQQEGEEGSKTEVHREEGSLTTGLCVEPGSGLTDSLALRAPGKYALDVCVNACVWRRTLANSREELIGRGQLEDQEPFVGWPVA